jgi:hypothetical protein
MQDVQSDFPLAVLSVAFRAIPLDKRSQTVKVTPWSNQSLRAIM